MESIPGASLLRTRHVPCLPLHQRTPTFGAPRPICFELILWKQFFMYTWYVIRQWALKWRLALLGSLWVVLRDANLIPLSQQKAYYSAEIFSKIGVTNCAYNFFLTATIGVKKRFLTFSKNVKKRFFVEKKRFFPIPTSYTHIFTFMIDFE